MYQLFVGEIGIPRREFLYEIKAWEARRIVRGYRKRDKLKHQLLAEVVYASIYMMRDPKGKTVADLFPQFFEDEHTNNETQLSDNEVKELQEELAAMNAKNESGQ